MSHHLESKPVARAELESEAFSEDDDSVDHSLEAQFREYFEPQYANGTFQSQDSDENKVEDANNGLVEPNTSHEDEAYSFRLFAKPRVPGPQEGEEQGPQKISLRSPSPASGEPGFVHTERPATYYFTGGTSAERAEQYRIAAVSGEQLLRGLGTRWPGFEMPWRVTILNATGGIMAASSLDTSQTVIVKKKRVGKKRRIAIRKHKAGEREKRTKKNREKKVKKRQKEKLKKAEEGEISGIIPSLAGIPGVGDPT